MNLQRKMFERLYRRAPSADALPWHRAQPALLEQVVAQRPSPGRALDLGCGQGLHSVYLAQQGFSVVGVDFVPAAIAAARANAANAGVEVDFREGDVTEFRAETPFDVVLDSGCLHHLPKAKVAAYRQRLDDWLAPGGDFVLVHFAHRGRIPLPKSPNHLTAAAARSLFAPLELRAEDEITFDVPLPMRHMRAGVYWFTRTAP